MTGMLIGLGAAALILVAGIVLAVVRGAEVMCGSLPACHDGLVLARIRGNHR